MLAETYANENYTLGSFTVRFWVDNSVGLSIPMAVIWYSYHLLFVWTKKLDYTRRARVAPKGLLRRGVHTWHTPEHDNSKINQIEINLPPRTKWTRFWTPLVHRTFTNVPKTDPIELDVPISWPTQRSSDRPIQRPRHLLTSISIPLYTIAPSGQ